MVFIDTNYFLRFILNHNSDQHKISKSLFMAGAEGKKYLFTSLVVIFEVYWVLSSFYGFSKEKVVETLKKILAMSFLNIAEKEILKKGLEIYAKSNLDFEDSYNLIYAKTYRAKTFATFDKKLQKHF